MIKYTAERDPRTGYGKAVRVLGVGAATNEARLFRHAVAPLPTISKRKHRRTGAKRGGKYA